MATFAEIKRRVKGRRLSDMKQKVAQTGRVLKRDPDTGEPLLREREGKMPALSAGMRAGAMRLGDTVLSIPEMIINQLLLGGRGPPPGSDLPPRPQLDLSMENVLSAGGALEDMVGGFARGEPVSPSEAFSGRQATQAQLTEKMEQDRPLATGTGRLAADLATVGVGKRALKGGLGRQVNRGVQRTASMTFGPPGAGRLLRRTIQGLKEAAAPLTRRTAETAGEGAALAALSGQDVKTGATVGAGLELGTAVPKAILSEVLGGKKANLATRTGRALAAPIMAMGYLAGLRMLAPGGEERVLYAIEQGGDEVAMAMALGIPAAMATARFGKGSEFVRDLPTAAAILEMIPRGTFTRAITNFIEAPPTLREDVAQAADRFMSNPMAFGDFRAEIEKALAQGTFSEKIQELRDDPRFQELMRRPPNE